MVCLLIERGHTNVMEYEYFFFLEMVESSNKVRYIEESRMATIMRISQASEKMDKDLKSLFNIKASSREVKSSAQDLMALQSQL